VPDGAALIRPTRVGPVALAPQVNV
jgi:hypothetical protein